ncbi:MAG: hypothetical protein HC887_00965 [Desulfobacteraceae bacterium]|nr:hypothetical protein [Desulfobacteraceae bacterium]
MKAALDIFATPESDDATKFNPADCANPVFYEIVTQSDNYNKNKQNEVKKNNIGCGCFSILAIIIMTVYALPHF